MNQRIGAAGFSIHIRWRCAIHRRVNISRTLPAAFSFGSSTAAICSRQIPPTGNSFSSAATPSAAVCSRPSVEAARALGAPLPRILLLHVIPSVIGYAIVAATLSIPGFILGESALSLLGLGIQEPSSSWGNMLAQAEDVQNLMRYP